MKRSVFIMFFLMIFISIKCLESSIISYKDSWGKEEFNLLTESDTGIEIIFSINELVLQEVNINSEIMTQVQIPGHFLPNDEGMPDLPGNGTYIAIPQGATPQIEVISSRVEIISDIDIAPAPRIPWDNETGPLEYSKNELVYSTDSFYPEDTVKLSELTQIRGVDVVILGITPFQYNPVSRELRIYRDFHIEITYLGGNGHFGDDRLRSRWFDPILQNIILNRNSLPDVNYPASISRTEDYEYIIIVPDDPVFLNWADSLRVFRNEQGINTGVVTTSEIGGNTPIAIENYINNAYNTWDVPPVGVLLLGDYGTAGSTIISPIWNSYCVSDHIYADVNNNSMADVILGRITAQNADHLEIMINKVLDYERNPSENPGFYNNPITALGWQTERWFQICAESVGGFWFNELGKDRVRINEIYEGNPDVDPWSTATNTYQVVNYFGPNSLNYIPAYPSQLGGWTGGNSIDINNAINSGAFMLVHRDHGGETGWGEPSYHNSDLSGLSNEDLVYVFSINCLTGKFNINGECFAEAFHRHEQGAIGLIAASEVSYSFVNDTFVWGMIDHMWGDFMPDYGTAPQSSDRIMPAFANASGKYFLQYSNWPYNNQSKPVTYNLFHHHGDVFTNLYSEMPQSLSVVHDDILIAGLETFTVTADEGSLIGLSVNGEFIGAAEGTGSPVTIQIPAQIPNEFLKITVTKQNYYRYSEEVDIISPEQYIICDSVSFVEIGGHLDDSFQSLDTLQIDVTFMNIGLQPTGATFSATLSTESDFVNIIDDSTVGAQIPALGISFIEDAFRIELLPEIEDNTTISFEVEISSGGESWVSEFDIIVHAPVLVYESFELEVTSGSDQILDPGESGEIYITLQNMGNGFAYETSVYLSTDDPYVSLTGEEVIPSILPGESASTLQPLYITISEESPIEYFASIDVYALDSGGITGEGNFNLAIGFMVFNFENDDIEWDHYPLTENYLDEWHLSDYRNHTLDGSYSMKCGGEDGSYYSSFIHAALVMPEIELTSDSSVKFYHWMDAGPASGSVTWDGGLIEISTDGENWTQVEPVGGYPYTAGDLPICPFPVGTGLFAGDFDWEEVELVLSGYIGTVQLRWVFGSCLEPGEGWYIDDISLTNYTAIDDELLLTNETYLGGNYPNPFNPATTISYNLLEDSHVSINIYNIKGQKVKNMLNSDMTAGEHIVVWEGRDESGKTVSSGIYFYKMEADNYTSIKKMILLK